MKMKGWKNQAKFKNNPEDSRKEDINMVSMSMNALIVMVSTVEPAELQFLLNTDPSGTKMKIQTWLSSTKRELDSSVSVRESKKENAKFVKPWWDQN